MAAYTIATHPVKDFDVWKNVFDKFESVRKEGGERSAFVLRHADDPNMVTIINAIEACMPFIAWKAGNIASFHPGIKLIAKSTLISIWTIISIRK